MNSIAALREQYLSLVNDQLPNRAKEGLMPVRFNHCFARIILDNLFEGCWYDHLSRKQPAYKQLDESQLEKGIAIAQTMLSDPKAATQFNQNSLRWRGKN
ncbi:MAG: hypothetical protein AAF716_00130 [Cyanobacteria bacterium P01_D01_bin.1]